MKPFTCLCHKTIFIHIQLSGWSEADRGATLPSHVDVKIAGGQHHATVNETTSLQSAPMKPLSFNHVRLVVVNGLNNDSGSGWDESGSHMRRLTEKQS